jgi:hypothetical protein
VSGLCPHRGVAADGVKRGSRKLVGVFSRSPPNMIVVQWSVGASGMDMAMVAAETGEVYYPPISFHGVGAASFDLPLLIPGLSVSRNPEIEFRLNSRLMVIKATPKQTEQHPSYTYYFLWQGDRWTLLKRFTLKTE